MDIHILIHDYAYLVVLVMGVEDFHHDVSRMTVVFRPELDKELF